MAPAADRDKALDAALAQIDRQFGKGSVMRLGDDVRAPIEVIPTGSIALDIALGIGGLPRGRVVEIYGPESSGKTTVALHAIANAQKAGGIAAFIDAEHALDPDYAQKLGVDTDALLVSQPDTGEQALEIADMLIRSNALDIIVIDSVAALVPRAEIEGEMGDSHVGLQARLMSQALRKLTGALHNSKTTAIFINQLREKIGVMFGCFSYDTRVTLADGTQEKIGKIVNQKLPVEVLSWDADDRSDRRRARSSTGSTTGPTEQVPAVHRREVGRERSARSSPRRRTTSSGRPAVGARRRADRPATGSWQSETASPERPAVAGRARRRCWATATSSPNRRDRHGVRFRLGHGLEAGGVPRLEGRRCSGTSTAAGARTPRVLSSPTSRRCRSSASSSEVVYLGDGKKHHHLRTT